MSVTSNFTAKKNNPTQTGSEIYLRVAALAYAAAINPWLVKGLAQFERKHGELTAVL